MLDLNQTAKDLELLIIKRAEALSLPAKNPEYGIDHLKWLCRQVYNEQVSGYKAYMYLAYAHGAIISNGGSDLEEVKELMKYYDYE